jgi:iron-sulfur cluster repair protein YtfE (RIC family)
MGQGQGQGRGRNKSALEMLSRSHRKLEQHADMLVAGEVEEAIEFFTRSTANHFADEEQSLFPRLQASPLLEQLVKEHREHEDLLARLKASLDGDGDTAALAKQLAAAYRAHTELEDRDLLPQLEALDADTQQAIKEEMRARRGK